MSSKKKIPDTQTVTETIAKDLGLSSDEFAYICKKLERTPNYAELGIFSAMYSEHCSYKSSKHALKRFPTTGKRVLQGPGENAGIIDVGEGWGVAFKMESHNHPSFIEPYQGAATGVGGILRDVFTMGARPIASMNGLFFGSPYSIKMRSVVKGVVKGIGDYGNSVGVPTIAGQTFFHPCYDQNPLVNAFTLGLIKNDEIFRGYASGIGNPVVYVGAKTGRDGVHGATMASKEFSTEEEPDRPTVQVGDPFTEKLLLEASLEVMNKGLVIGIQDMGAAGLTSSSFEMADRAQTGLKIHLDRIPTRETGMSAYELLLSESQERMLLVTEEKHLEPLKKIFDKWDLHAVVIGEVVEGSRVQMDRNGEKIVDIPVDLVVHPPEAARPKSCPPDLNEIWSVNFDEISSLTLETKIKLLKDPDTFAFPGPLAEQYDSMVGNRTSGDTYDDAAVLRLREIKTKSLRLGLTVDCNPRICVLWPKEGGRRAVTEAAINLAVRGALPLGITDCLNFGSPENPEVMWQFDEAVDGVSEACKAFDTPVVSGNVSFYNETDGKPIYPTPTIGMVGLIDHKHPLPKSSFREPDLEVALLGNVEGGLGGSLLAYQYFKKDCGKPEKTDLDQAKKMISFLLDLSQKGLNYSAHDISDGGLITSVYEMLLYSSVENIGFDLTVPGTLNLDRFLFGETIPRILIAYDLSEKSAIQNLCNETEMPLTALGKTTHHNRFQISYEGSKIFEENLSQLRDQWIIRWKPFFE